jgi:hypothetical protein
MPDETLPPFIQRIQHTEGEAAPAPGQPQEASAVPQAPATAQPAVVTETAEAAPEAPPAPSEPVESVASGEAAPATSPDHGGYVPLGHVDPLPPTLGGDELVAWREKWDARAQQAIDEAGRSPDATAAQAEAALASLQADMEAEREAGSPAFMHRGARGAAGFLRTLAKLRSAAAQTHVNAATPEADGEPAQSAPEAANDAPSEAAEPGTGA